VFFFYTFENDEYYNHPCTQQKLCLFLLLPLSFLYFNIVVFVVIAAVPLIAINLISYSVPNCILPLVGGVLSDHFGIRVMLVRRRIP
jgi:hypothetical protein